MSEDTRTASEQSVQTECKTLYLSLLCFLRITGNAGHHEGHLRHDGKMHIPRPQRGDAPSARRSILSGKQAVGRFYCFMYEASENLHISPFVCLQQKMDKNKDGVVTIDEFIDCCQNVRPIPQNISSHCCWHSLSTAHRIVSYFVSSGWKHHAIDAPLWKRSLIFGWLWRIWKRPSSLAWPSYWLGLILCTVCYADFLTIDTVILHYRGPQL